jgi:hypothetical protein
MQIFIHNSQFRAKSKGCTLIKFQNNYIEKFQKSTHYALFVLQFKPLVKFISWTTTSQRVGRKIIIIIILMQIFQFKYFLSTSQALLVA